MPLGPISTPGVASAWTDSSAVMVEKAVAEQHRPAVTGPCAGDGQRDGGRGGDRRGARHHAEVHPGRGHDHVAPGHRDEHGGRGGERGQQSGNGPARSVRHPRPSSAEDPRH